MKRNVPLYEEFLNESKTIKFEVGDNVQVDNKEKVKKIKGLRGKVIFVDKNQVYVDFGKKLSDSGVFLTNNLHGKISTDTGLIFYKHTSIEKMIDPGFNIKNLNKI